jgi:ribonucleotide monophosphatase NagD (HAD superfamily)
VYAGAGSIPHAVESLNRTKAERPVGYITNNASRSDASVARHLAELGLEVVRRT